MSLTTIQVRKPACETPKRPNILLIKGRIEMVRLFAFTCGWFQAPMGFFLDGGEKEVVRSPVPAYLIQHPKGLALFDTGLGRRFIQEKGFKLGPNQTGYEFDESADIAVRLRA